MRTGHVPNALGGPMARGLSALDINVTHRGGIVEILLSGAISEKVAMNVPDGCAGCSVVIDAGGVLGINSFGVRTWVNFVQGLEEVSTSVTVRRLPPVLVTQASMITNFLTGVSVESYFSPWCCLDCDHEALELHRVADQLPEAVPCPECPSEMEFDGVRDSYLAFLSDLDSTGRWVRGSGTTRR